jgi:hypothetical protein
VSLEVLTGRCDACLSTTFEGSTLVVVVNALRLLAYRVDRR